MVHRLPHAEDLPSTGSKFKRFPAGGLDEHAVGGMPVARGHTADVQVEPYPYARWPQITRPQLRMLQTFVRSLRGTALEELTRTGEALFGAKVSAEAGLPFVDTTSRDASTHDVFLPMSVHAVLQPRMGAFADRVVVEIEPRLAACMADRAWGGQAEARVPAATTELSAEQCGALAYALARWMAPCETLGGWQLAAVVASQPARRRSLPPEPRLVWPLRVSVGADVGVVRLWSRGGGLLAHPTKRSGFPWPTLPVTLKVEGGRGTVRAKELATVSQGDVLVLDEMYIRLDFDELAGPARATIVGTRYPVWQCDIKQGSATIARIEHDERAPTGSGKAHTMPPEEQTDPIFSLAGDAPVEVSLEIARCSLSLAELARLAPGEVLGTGATIGQPVTLYAAGRAFATGELVSVDGEVGVRILTLLSPET